jgi:DNA-binding response OmpR family regulator
MKTIVCIEDQPDYQEIFRRTLKDFSLVMCSTLQEGKDYFESNSPCDLVVIDVSLPDGDGIRFYSLHKDHFEGRGIPAIFLSASTDIENKLTALRLGAEDYLCKPIHPLELKVRIEAKLERSEKKKEEANQVRVGDLIIDLDRQQVICTSSNDSLDLTGLEFRLLLHFSRNIDRVLSREQILDQVWGQKVAVQDRTVDTHVSHLRKKIGDLAFRIEPVQGMGYRASLAKSND